MKIAVVGTGIAGLGAAYVLSRTHEVELFERNRYAGGHTHTVTVSHGGRRLALDTGFVVHNERNYPHLIRLFRELGIRTRDSDMSFSVTCARCRLQYSGRRPFAQPSNVLRPAFMRLLTDIARFLRTARTSLGDPRYEDATLAEYVDRERYSRQFRDHYLVPLTAAIWSTAPDRTLEFPMAYALRFFDNHGMLGFRRHVWKTVAGGSREYVQAILARIAGSVHLDRPVVAIRRQPDGVELRTARGDAYRYDGVVVATHADEALGLIEDPSSAEQRLLGAFGYTRNETVLHTDERLLPVRHGARASWNFHMDDCRVARTQPTVTYYLNRLQRLEEAEHFCVTLNREAEIREDRVIERVTYEHPLYTHEALAAQSELPALNGLRRTAFCGAYHGYGFHEDGLVAGLAAARAFGVDW